jgi:hypothetical protein
VRDKMQGGVECMDTHMCLKYLEDVYELRLAAREGEQRLQHAPQRARAIMGQHRNRDRVLHSAHPRRWR